MGQGSTCCLLLPAPSCSFQFLCIHTGSRGAQADWACAPGAQLPGPRLAGSFLCSWITCSGAGPKLPCLGRPWAAAVRTGQAAAVLSSSEVVAGGVQFLGSGSWASSRHTPPRCSQKLPWGCAGGHGVNSMFSAGGQGLGCNSRLAGWGRYRCPEDGTGKCHAPGCRLRQPPCSHHPGS